MTTILATPRHYSYLRKEMYLLPLKNYPRLSRMKKGVSIASIRSDHGEEFQNKEFEQFYNKNGI